MAILPSGINTGEKHLWALDATLNSAMIAATCTMAFIPQLAFAYVGPGAGISLLGALWGLIVGVVMALGIVLFFPIRIMLRKRKAAAEAKNADMAEAHTTESAASAKQESDQTP